MHILWSDFSSILSVMKRFESGPVLTSLKNGPGRKAPLSLLIRVFYEVQKKFSNMESQELLFQTATYLFCTVTEYSP